MNDISAFLGFGKRFSVDIKLHGIGCIVDKVQYENIELDSTELSEKIIPLVVALCQSSTDPRVVRLADNLALGNDMTEYSVEALGLLAEFILDINQLQ